MSIFSTNKVSSGLSTAVPVPTPIGRNGKKKVVLRDLHKVKNMLRGANLHSVCEEARCPNRTECFQSGTATFLAMGNICTRTCRFCQIAAGAPAPLDPDEPQKLADAAAKMRLKHVVVTSVNRDDLPDGGARHLQQILQQIKDTMPAATTEVLTPDFKGDLQAVATVCAANPEVFNHNLETVPSLYRTVRPGARLDRSLAVLSQARRLLPQRHTKSGLMLGLGETDDELADVFKRLAEAKVDILTLGQYFQPSKNHLPVVEMVDEKRFDSLKQIAELSGIPHVYAGRYVRSSYNAGLLLEQIRERGSHVS